jgi:hypothetical protein
LPQGGKEKSFSADSADNFAGRAGALATHRCCQGCGMIYKLAPKGGKSAKLTIGKEVSPVSAGPRIHLSK